jgi:hypothetical protein
MFRYEGIRNPTHFHMTTNPHRAGPHQLDQTALHLREKALLSSSSVRLQRGEYPVPASRAAEVAGFLKLFQMTQGPDFPHIGPFLRCLAPNPAFSRQAEVGYGNRGKVAPPRPPATFPPLPQPRRRRKSAGKIPDRGLIRLKAASWA